MVPARSADGELFQEPGVDVDPRDRKRPTPTKLAERQLPIRAVCTSGWAEKAARYDSGLDAHRCIRPAKACSAPSHRTCCSSSSRLDHRAGAPRRTSPGAATLAQLLLGRSNDFIRSVSFHVVTAPSFEASEVGDGDTGYDDNGNLVSETTGAVVKGYTWDADNRLRQVAMPSGADYSYDYDANGLRVRSYYQPPPVSPWAVSATASSQYTATDFSAAQATGAPDTVGCADSPKAWSPLGNTTAPEWLLLTYGTPVKATGVRIHEVYVAPFVTKVELVDVAGATHVVWQGQDTTACGDWLTVTFPETSYEVSGVRISTAATGYEKIDAVALDSAPQAPVSPAVTSYLLDGASVVAELDSLGNATTRYVTNPTQLDEILSFTTGGAAYYPLVDGLGSIVAISDANGLVVRSNSYDVYGEKTTAGVGPPLASGFTGREHDATGLRNHRDRYADPVTGRWTQPDRLGMIDGPNLYQYGRGNPALLTDPSGFDALIIVAMKYGERLRDWLGLHSYPLSESNGRAYLDAITAEVQRQRGSPQGMAKIVDLSFSTNFRTEPITSLSDLAILASEITAADRIYDEFYFIGHGAEEEPLLSMYTPSGVADFLSPADIVSFLAITGAGTRATGIIGCKSGDNGFSSAVGLGLSRPVFGTFGNIDRRVTYQNNGYSNQFERIEFRNFNLGLFP